MNFLVNALRTCCFALGFCVVWMLLERAFYGAVEPRTVDDIMMVLFIPFLYKAVAKSN